MAGRRRWLANGLTVTYKGGVAGAVREGSMRNRAMSVGLLAAALATGPAAAQQRPSDLTARPAVPTDFVPERTAWGDPDFRGTWPLELVFRAGIPLERPEPYGDRAWMTDEEFAVRLAATPRANFALDAHADAPSGLADWLRSTPFGRRTSLIVDPANGRLPPMTPEGHALYAAGRNSFKDGQRIEWLTDLDSYDRCITRNLAAAILPWPENNGVRVFQSPGFVVLQLEVLGTRVIPVGHGERWPEALRSWMGQSLGHWEGDTLVIETGAILAGDSASSDLSKRASSPITGRPGGVVPMSAKARAVERLTMTGPNTIMYEITYSDPDVYTAPWTAAIEWTRDEGYRLYEFACHERNEVRHMITGSRAHRSLDQATPRGSGVPQQDGTGRWPFPPLDDTGEGQAE